MKISILLAACASQALVQAVRLSLLNSKDEPLPLSETNMALVGSAQDKANRKAAALTEEAWQGAGLKAGVQIWRIMQFKVTHWPEEQHGQFYENDAYIILRTEEVKLSDGSLAAKTFGAGNKLVRSIHFWLGKGSAIDEQGTAAYKTVELDQIFDGACTQHREVMSHESDEFKAIFSGNLTYLKGGTKSGFRHVEKKKFDTQLLQIRRTKAKDFKVYKVPLRLSSLNQDDCFVLASGLDVFKWEGNSTSFFSKFKANDVASYVHGKRPYSRMTLVEDKEPKGLQSSDPFWQLLSPDGDIHPSGQVTDEMVAQSPLAPEFNPGVEVIKEAPLTGVKEVTETQLYFINGTDIISTLTASTPDAIHEFIIAEWKRRMSPDNDEVLDFLTMIVDPGEPEEKAEIFALYGPAAQPDGTVYTTAATLIQRLRAPVETAVHVLQMGQMILNPRFAKF